MFKFNTLINAKDFADKATKTLMIVLGDDNKYWVVSFKDALKLVKAGYELAE